MICRKLYAHKGSILLNSRSIHGIPRRFFSSGLLCRGPCMLFLLGSVLYRAGAGWHGNAVKKTAFRRAGPNFERPLLRAICFFCGVLKKGYSIPPGGSAAAVPGRTGEMCGLWDCHKIQLENHQQLGIKTKNKNKTNAKWWHQRRFSDEDALKRPFPFTLGVNNPN